MNKKISLSFVLLSLLMIVFTACSSDEEASLPNYLMGYGTILKKGPISDELSIRLDDGKVYPLDTMAVKMNLNNFDSLRVICYYTKETSASANSKRHISNAMTIKLASVAPAQLPLMAGASTKDDPLSLVSMSKGTYFLNVVFKVLRKEKPHLFYARTIARQYDKAGKVHIGIRIYHDYNGDYPAYSAREYLSIPLYSYWNALQNGGSVGIQYTDKDGVEQHQELTF